MLIGKSIAKNTIIHLIGKIGGLILGLLSLGILTRYLGTDGFGNYTIVVAYLQFFGTLVDFGLSLTVIQMLAKPGVDENKTMNSVMSLRVVSAVLFLLIPCLLVWFWPWNSAVKIGVLINVGTYFFVSLMSSLTGIFQHKLAIWKVSFADLFSRLLLVFGVWLCAYYDWGFFAILAVITVANFIDCLLIFIFSKKYIQWRWQIDWLMWKDIWRNSWPIALSIIFNLIYLRMDTIIMSFCRPIEEVGFYGATYRILDILTMLPAVFMGIVLPQAAKIFAEKNFVELKMILQKAFDILMFFAWPIVFGGFFLAKKIMVFVAGESFAPSGQMLKILIFAVLAIFATTLFSYAIVAINEQKKMMWGFLTAAILTFLGYLIFIPRFGWLAAAYLTIFSEIIIMIWSAILLWRKINFLPKIKNNLFFILFSVLMILLLSLFAGQPLLIEVLLGAGFYLSLTFVFKRKIMID